MSAPDSISRQLSRQISRRLSWIPTLPQHILCYNKDPLAIFRPLGDSTVDVSDPDVVEKLPEVGHSAFPEAVLARLFEEERGYPLGNNYALAYPYPRTLLANLLAQNDYYKLTRFASRTLRVHNKVPMVMRNAMFWLDVLAFPALVAWMAVIPVTNSIIGLPIFLFILLLVATPLVFQYANIKTALGFVQLDQKLRLELGKVNWPVKTRIAVRREKRHKMCGCPTAVDSVYLLLIQVGNFEQPRQHGVASSEQVSTTGATGQPVRPPLMSRPSLSNPQILSFYATRKTASGLPKKTDVINPVIRYKGGGHAVAPGEISISVPHEVQLDESKAAVAIGVEEVAHASPTAVPSPQRGDVPPHARTAVPDVISRQ